MRRCVVSVVSLVLILMGLLGGAAPPAGAQAGPPGVGPAIAGAGLVDLGGGRRLYLECRGTGSPTVILEAGYRSLPNVWTDDLLQPDRPRTMVLPGVAAVTRVCAYDRPGPVVLLDGELVASRSDPVPMPRAAPAVVADLHALLRAAGVPGPYVLAGHSMGGLFARLYAATYPDEVAGLILVDAWSETLEQRLTPAQWAAYVRLNARTPPGLEAVRDLETLDFAAASATMRRAATARPLRALPLAVVSKGEPFGIPAADLGFAPDALDRAWSGAQGDLAALVPHARHVVAAESAHYVQLQQPELVIAAIREVVEAVRRAPPPARRGLPRTGTGPMLSDDFAG